MGSTGLASAMESFITVCEFLVRFGKPFHHESGMPGPHGLPAHGLSDGVELLPPVVRAEIRAHTTQVLESMNAAFWRGSVFILTLRRVLHNKGVLMYERCIRGLVNARDTLRDI